MEQRVKQQLADLVWNILVLQEQLEQKNKEIKELKELALSESEKKEKVKNGKG